MGARARPRDECRSHHDAFAAVRAGVGAFAWRRPAVSPRARRQPAPEARGGCRTSGDHHHGAGGGLPVPAGTLAMGAGARAALSWIFWLGALAIVTGVMNAFRL